MTASPEEPLGFRLTRRRLLQAGTLGLLGIDLPRMLHADTVRSILQRQSAADSCILVMLNGGPSHLDMWDMKPDAPAEIRGEFKPIASSLPGVPLSEHLPRLARVMDRCSLIRSAHHSVNNAHAAAVYAALTGHDRGELGGGAKPTDYPSIGSVLGMKRPTTTGIAPAVTMPYITKEGAGGPPQPGYFGGWMGRAFDPLFVLRDPNDADFAIPELSLSPDVDPRRLTERRGLLKDVDAALSPMTSVDAGFRTVSGFHDLAFRLLSSTANQQAFRLDLEPDSVRDSYGRNIYGQSVLLARRLIEAGTRVATVSWAPDANATWDTHGSNFRSLKDRLLPQLDAAVSSLIVDLEQRGLLERTLVVVMGEFGRSPRVNKDAGRDHWNFCYSLLMAGGGIKPGVVHGSSDRIGGHPKDDPCGPADIVATIYNRLGVPHDTELRDRLDRSFQLVPWGEPLEDLLV